MRQIKRMGAAIAAAAMLFSLMPSEIPVPAEAKIVTNPYSWDFADERNEIVSGAAYTMMVRLSGKFITAAENGNVHQWEKLGDTSQQWIITKIGNGACKIVSAQDPQLSLTVANGDSTNGNNIYLSEYEDLRWEDEEVEERLAGTKVKKEKTEVTEEKSEEPEVTEEKPEESEATEETSEEAEVTEETTEEAEVTEEKTEEPEVTEETTEEPEATEETTEESEATEETPEEPEVTEEKSEESK